MYQFKIEHDLLSTWIIYKNKSIHNSLSMELNVAFVFNPSAARLLK